MNSAVKWSQINRLRARVANGTGLSYPQAEHDCRLAIEELDHQLTDASHLRVEKALIWNLINRTERLERFKKAAGWAGIIVLWAAGIFTFIRAGACP